MSEPTPQTDGAAERSLDGMLMLLDRQIVDVEGRMVGKVDDVELVERADPAGSSGTLVVNGLLLGPAALVFRLGGRFGDLVRAIWGDLGRERADHDAPGWIDLALVDDLGSRIRLRVGRDGLVRPQPGHGDKRHHRLGELLGMAVYREGDRVGRVIDVRLDGEAVEHGDTARVIALVVGRGRPGARLGYDRHPEQGPWLLSRLVQAVQGGHGLIDMDAVTEIDWIRERVWISRPPNPLHRP